MAENMFKWESLLEIEELSLMRSGEVIVGSRCEVELTCGKSIRVWRSRAGREYFCHGLTFGGKEAPFGAISPFTGEPVETILQEYFDMIPEEAALPGDILVWRGIAPESTPHSAILTEARKSGNRLDYGAKLQSKHGLGPERNASLAELVEIYGESYASYRRRTA